MEEKRVLITGGAGFIGSNLSKKLIKLGFEVTVLDNLSPQVHGQNPDSDSDLYNQIKDKVNFIKGSVNNREDLIKAIKHQDYIIHLAAETGTGQSMYQIYNYTQTNIMGLSLLLETLQNTSNQVKKIVLSSSRAIYGEGRYRLNGKYVYPLHRREKELSTGNFEVTFEGSKELELCATDENSELHPSSVYGITKMTQEQILSTVAPTLNIPYVILRYQNVYGPGQSLQNPYTGILSIFSTQLLNGHELNIFEDGLESRDFIFIEDVVEATHQSLVQEKANNQIFNVGTGIATPVIKVAGLLKENYKTTTGFRISGQYRIGDIRHNFADISKIQNALGWKPQVSFEQGIREFTRWVKSQKIKEDRLSESLEELKQKGLLK